MDIEVITVLLAHIITPFVVIGGYHLISTKIAVVRKNEEAVFRSICAVCLLYAFLDYVSLYITFANWSSQDYARLSSGIATRLFIVLGLLTSIMIYRSRRASKSDQRK